MSLANKLCLYSVVKNTSGVAKTFSFLPPHGVFLLANQEYVIFGNVLEMATAAERSSQKRAHQALASALDRGDIEIMQTPSPITWDVAAAAPKALQSSSGVITGVAPCYLSTATDRYESDIPDTVVPAGYPNLR